MSRRSLEQQLLEYGRFEQSTRDEWSSSDVVRHGKSVRPISHVGAQKPVPVKRRPAWIGAVAALAAVALVGVVAMVAQNTANREEPATTPTSTDRTASTVTSDAAHGGWSEAWVTHETAPPLPWGGLGDIGGHFFFISQGVQVGTACRSGEDCVWRTEPIDPNGVAWLYVSYDGESWTRTEIEQLQGLGLNPGHIGATYFVTTTSVTAGTQDSPSTRILRSDDGVQWDPVLLDTEDDVRLNLFGPSWYPYRSAAFIGDTYVTTGQKSGEECLWVSHDAGGNFTCVRPPIEAVDAEFASPGAGALRLGQIVVINDVFVVLVGTPSGSGRMIVTHALTSRDGDSWGLAAVEEPLSVDAATIQNDSALVMSGTSERTLVYQVNLADGGIWFDAIGSIPRSIGDLDPVVFTGGERLVAIFESFADYYDDDQIWVSTNGRQWTALAAPAVRIRAGAVNGTIFASSWRGVEQRWKIWINAPS